MNVYFQAISPYIKCHSVYFRRFSNLLGETLYCFFSNVMLQFTIYANHACNSRYRSIFQWVLVHFTEGGGTSVNFFDFKTIMSSKNGLCGGKFTS